jgi:predicted nucleotidyltransferase
LTIARPSEDARGVESANLARSCRSVAYHLVAALEAVLGDELVGLYAYGSAVVGPFDEGVSDLDLVVVTRGEADSLDLGRLRRVHAGAIDLDRQWSDRLELVYVGLESLRAARAGSNRVAVVSPGEPLHLTGPAGDWLMNWYLVRETGLALAGSRPGQVFPSIEWDEFAAAAVRYVSYLMSITSSGSSPGSLAYAVLSAMRALRSVETGRPCSKSDGAEYGRRRFPAFALVIDEAEACRLTRGSAGFDAPESRIAAVELVASVARELSIGDSGPDC